ncbi:hypothetical protein [Nocardia sp. NPDC004415]
MTVVQVRDEGGLLVLTPGGAPLVTDAVPGLDVLVLEVVGGHLSWNLHADEALPGAVLDDRGAAQDWLWAVYGETVAVAVADDHPQTLTAEPAQPDLVTDLRRLAYAHWVTRWWPASTIDAIPALDHDLLTSELAALTERCEMVVGGADLTGTADPSLARESGSARTASPTSPASEPARRAGRREDYALAAGGAMVAGGLVVARGTGGWDWRRCPPGILDASEQAVTWEVSRAAGVSTVRVSVVAAPDCREPIPTHLRPVGYVGAATGANRLAGQTNTPIPDLPDTGPAVTSGGSDSDAPTRTLAVALRSQGDSWVGHVQLPDGAESAVTVDVFVPGVGPADPPEDESAQRERIRDFARERLTGANGFPRLAAEAVAEEEDF